MGDMNGYIGKVAVVTGAAGGIGRVTARMFAAQGYTVVAVDIEEAVFDEENIHFRRADLCSYDDICGVFDYATGSFGGVHVLVNNGAISKFAKSVFEITPEEFRRVIDTNLCGSFMCCKRFIEANRGIVYGKVDFRQN